MRINKAILKNIGKAAAKENARYALQAIKFEQTGDECRAIATDAKILTLIEWRSPENGLADGSLIRAKDCAKMARIGGAGSRFPEVLLADGEENYAAAATNGESVAVQKDEGKFPAWREVLPADKGPYVDVSADCLGRALESLAGSVESDRIRLYLGVRGRPMTIEATNPDSRQGVAVVMPLAAGKEDKRPTADESQHLPWRRPGCDTFPDHYLRHFCADWITYGPLTWHRDRTRYGFNGSVNGEESLQVCPTNGNVWIQWAGWRAGQRFVVWMEVTLSEFEARYGQAPIDEHGNLIDVPEAYDDLAYRLPFEGSITRG